MAEEQVLAMDDDTDTDSDAPIQLPIPPVDIVPFPDFNNLEPLMPEEIQENELLGWVNANPAGDDNIIADPMQGGQEDGNLEQGDKQQHHFNQNLQLGFVQILDAPYREWSQFTKLAPCPEAIRLWVKHFSQSAPNSPSILISDDWVNFFSFLLMQSPTFDWASSFLQSKAWNFINDELSSSGKATQFTIPKSCPQVNLSICSNFGSTSSVGLEPFNEDLEMDLDVDNAVMTPPKGSKKNKGKAPISEAEVRRSTRLKMINKGFKSSVCKDKNCLGCSTSPPAISPKVIRSLGASFCDIDPKELSSSKLNDKPAKKKAVSKKIKKDSPKTTDQNPNKESDGEAGASST
jgi:hypothetical protein